MKKYEMIKDYRKSPKKVYENIGCIKGTHRERDENGEIICELNFEKLLDESFLPDNKLILYINEQFLKLETDSKTYPGQTHPIIYFGERTEFVSMGRCEQKNYIIVFTDREFPREMFSLYIIAIIKEMDE